MLILHLWSRLEYKKKLEYFSIKQEKLRAREGKGCAQEHTAGGAQNTGLLPPRAWTWGCFGVERRFLDWRGQAAVTSSGSQFRGRPLFSQKLNLLGSTGSHKE